LDALKLSIGMQDRDSQAAAVKRLFAAVIATAFRDLATRGWERVYRSPRRGEPLTPKDLGITTHAFTAARFLFDETVTGVDAYLEWLDIDADNFRKRLLDMIYDKSAHPVAGWEPEQRRQMRMNYERWLTLRSQNITPEENDDE
jgi:hypothetical protein